MSTWNNCIKRFDNNKVVRLEHLFYVLGQEGWDNLTKEIEDETDGRITTVFTDEVRGVKSRYNSEDEFKTDLKLVNTILKKYEKMVKRGLEINCLCNYEEETAHHALEDRYQDKDWYVLRYDTETTEYYNEIVFQTFDEALKKFNRTKPTHKNERVELMFAPTEDDTEYFDNIVVKYKTL